MGATLSRHATAPSQVASTSTSTPGFQPDSRGGRSCGPDRDCNLLHTAIAGMLLLETRISAIRMSLAVAFLLWDSLWGSECGYTYLDGELQGPRGTDGLRHHDTVDIGNTGGTASLPSPNCLGGYQMLSFPYDTMSRISTGLTGQCHPRILTGVAPTAGPSDGERLILVLVWKRLRLRIDRTMRRRRSICPSGYFPIRSISPCLDCSLPPELK